MQLTIEHQIVILLNKTRLTPYNTLQSTHANHGLRKESIMEPKKKRKTSAEFSLGEVIDLLTDKDWDMLADIYMCRCMPQAALMEYYFLDTPAYHYPEYENATPEKKRELEEKNHTRALERLRRTVKRLKDRGLIEYTSFDPNASSLPAKKRTHTRSGITWYYLSSRGLKVVEVNRGILEENRLSKNDLDMERAKKEHFWELGKVYLDLRYNLLSTNQELRQYYEWDWYPSMTVYSDDETISVRPDAILRIGQQVFFVELDRSTEPIQRSPFHTEQVSIAKKLERYRNVFRLTTNEIIQKGIIAFIIPDAMYKTRLENIEKAAAEIFRVNNKVLTGKAIKDIILKIT